jgi:hypothetical protein
MPAPTVGADTAWSECAALLPPEMPEQLRRTIGEYNFAGQYQQAPSPLGDGMVKAAWFRSYAPNERLD